MNPQVPEFSQSRVLVVGDVMLDRYWHGSARRISPEAPVPVVKVDEREDRPGGAANVALNIAALGAPVSVLGVVGADGEARVLSDKLAAADVSAHLVEVADVSTIVKLRVISRQQQLIRLDFEGELPVSASAGLMEAFEALLPAHDIVVLSDYAKGTLREPEALIAKAREAGKPVLVDPKSPRAECYRGATVMTPNLAEFEAMAGPCANEQALIEKGLALIASLELEALLITRGEHGLTLLRAGQSELHLPSSAREVFDVTGAGDTVVAVTAAGLAAGAPLEHAVALANHAAGLVVSKLGTAAIGATELRRHVASQNQATRGVVNEAQLLTAIEDARARGERLVMTNGCFDLLHAGHVALLERARQLGDRLIVAVNDDASVARLKGAGRPVNGLGRRMSVLAALSHVDWVVPFGEETPERLIGAVLPDVLVKGADYKPEEIAGGDCVRAAGGEVRVIDLVEGVSTTALLQAMGILDE